MILDFQLWIRWTSHIFVELWNIHTPMWRTFESPGINFAAHSLPKWWFCLSFIISFNTSCCTRSTFATLKPGCRGKEQHVVSVSSYDERPKNKVATSLFFRCERKTYSFDVKEPLLRGEGAPFEVKEKLSRGGIFDFILTGELSSSLQELSSRGKRGSRLQSSRRRN